MPRNRISVLKVSKIFELYAINGLNKSQISTIVKVARGTVLKYVSYYEQSDLTYTDILFLNKEKLIERALPKHNSYKNNKKSDRLSAMFPAFHERHSEGSANLKILWEEYFQNDSSGYKYSQFTLKYSEWCQKNSLRKPTNRKWKVEHIEPADLETLNSWRLSTNRNKWEKAVALLGLYEGENIANISLKLERSIKTVKKWVAAFQGKGLENIDLRRTKKVTAEVKMEMAKKSDQIIKLLHEPPAIHGINRTSWSLETLSNAYKEQYDEPISKSTISKYIRDKGYSFKKAKIVLTSPDPDYRKKLSNIKRILSNLSEKEKFFSIDEYGPVAIKIRGGRSYALRGELNTVPQSLVSG